MSAIAGPASKQSREKHEFFVKNFLEDISPFCGTNGTTIFRLLVTSALDPSLACFVT